MPYYIPENEYNPDPHEIVSGPSVDACDTCVTADPPILDPNQLYAGCPAVVVTGGPEWANGTYKAVGATNSGGVFARDNTYPGMGTYLKETTELTVDGVVPPIYFEFNYMMGIAQRFLFNRNFDQVFVASSSIWFLYESI